MFPEILAKVAKALDARGVNYMVVGGRMRPGEKLKELLQ